MRNTFVSTQNLAIGEMNMRILATVVLLVGIVTYGTAKAEYFNLSWGIQFGSGGDEHYYYEDIGVDSTGNLYVVWLEGIEGSAVTTHFKKVDRMGNPFWHISEPRDFFDGIHVLKVDSQDNFCVFGYTNGPSGGTHYGGTDGLVRKYNPDGVMLWARQLGTSSYDVIMDGTFDNQNNVFVCGQSYGSLGDAPDGGCAVAAKYDVNGNLQWVKRYNVHPDCEQAQAIAISAVGEIYVGITSSDGSESSSQTFLIKLDSNGNLLWTEEIGIAGVYDGGFMFGGFDTDGKIVFRIHTKGQLGGVHQGGLDFAIGRCDGDGNIEWMGQYGTSSDDSCYALTVDSSVTITLAGHTEGSFFETNQGSDDAFLMQIAPGGMLLGGFQFGTSSQERLLGLSSSGNHYFVSGATNGSLWGTNLGIGGDIIVGKFYLEPSNDQKADALPVVVGYVIDGWTVGATGTDITRNGYNDCNDVWYYFEPEAKGKYTIEVYNATFDTTLAVFDENDKEIEFNDDFWGGDRSVVILKAKANKRYYIRVAGYDGETGDFTLSLQAGAIQPIQGDLDYDGNVNLNDLLGLAQNWMAGS